MKVELMWDDTYTVEFFRQTNGKIDMKTGAYREPKHTVKARYDNVYCDQLMDTFEEATGLYVTLYPRK